MNATREDLISKLAADAGRVRSPGRIAWRLAGWLVAAGTLTVLAVALDAPLHAPRWREFLAAPAVIVQALLGTVAILALGRSAFQLAIPGSGLQWKIMRWPMLLMVCWLAVALLAVHHPAMAPSLLGKRAHCLIETLYAGLPGLLLGCAALRRLWPLHGLSSGVLLGLACGSMPALLMLVVCMYDPLHHLLFHLLPGIALAIVGALAGRVLLRPR